MDKRYNIWKFLFWALLTFVVCSFGTLYCVGVMQVTFHRNNEHGTIPDLKRRDVIYEDESVMDKGDAFVNTDDGLDGNVVVDDSEVPLVDEGENKKSFQEDDIDDEEDDKDGELEGSPFNSIDGNGVDDENSRDDDKGAITEEGKTKVTDKKNILTEAELLKFHSKAVSKIWAPNIEKNLEYLSSKSHLGGTKESNELADWIVKTFKNATLDNVLAPKYNVLVSYPKKPGKIIFEGQKGKDEEELVIIEKKLDKFETTTNNSVYPPFLAYSKPSNESGELVYANYGSDADFRDLKKMGIDCKNKILIIRYGMLARNKKIKFAESCGAKGVILFSDPLVYSPTGINYPESWYLPPDGVMRGTLARMRGDALTRGYPAIDGFYRRPISEVGFYPTIPVQPIGFGHAEKIFKQLDGEKIPNKRWRGGLNLTYHVNSKSKSKVKLMIDVTREMRNIKNVIGVIEGTYEPDRIVLIGNHRDAWGYGAADPSSGTAVMVEVARVLGELKKEGWRPRRTIMICSWDAEEYGLLGSTEWTEQFSKILAQQAVAYVNVDTAVQGNHTIALRSTPELADVFFDAAHRFKDPDTTENLYDSWLRKHKTDKKDRRKEPKVTIFREGSDYMPFYGDLGIPSLDFRYMFDTDALGVYNIPVYHTMHDNIAWMRKFVDPDFRYHATIAQVLTRVILLLADSTLLPFNLIRYSDSMWARVGRLTAIIKENKIQEECDISLLTKLVKKLQKITRRFHKNVQMLDKEDELAVRQINDQMLLFERSFVANEDLVDDDKTRHVYHTSGLRRAAWAVVRAKKNGKKSALDKTVREFKTKYSIYTYHVMMALQALENPFLTKKKQRQHNQKRKQ